MKDAGAIVGIGHTEYSKDSGRSELQLAAEASIAAIRDAGLSPSDIDGMVTFTNDPNDELLLMRSLGIPLLRWWSRTPHGGPGSTACVELATAAVASGAANYVLFYRALNERSGRRFGQPNVNFSPPGWNWYLPYGLDTPAKWYALEFQRYMWKYGLTNEDFGRYTVVAREHAATNPDAWYYRKPITIEDHQASRWIVEPILRRLDCCQERDGGAALIITTPERARDLPQPAAVVAAATMGNIRGSNVMFNYYHPDLSALPEAESVSRQLFDVSGIGKNDVDVAMIYENFSPVVFMQLEACGFCGPGEARDFIVEGNIGLNGKLPVNPQGGLIGEAYIHGVNNVIEGVRQVRGTAVNQIAGAQNALVMSGRSGIMLRKA